MRSCRFAFVLLALTVLVSSAAQAGLADPPPTLAGQPSFHLWSVPGVVNNGMATVFSCSNAASSSIRVGVEIFGSAGGAALNNASATSLVLQAGETRMFATQSTVAFTADSDLLVGLVLKGSGRVLATANSGVICSVHLADPTHLPPTSMVSLTVISPNSQATVASSSVYGTTVFAGLLLVTGFSAAMMMRHRSVV